MSKPSNPPEPSLESLIVQALHGADEESGALITPLQPSTTFKRRPDGSEPQGRSYIRDHMATGQEAEAILARLEGGEDALLFSSGMAAATAVIQSLKPGDRLACPSVMYWALRSWFLEAGKRLDLSIDFFDPKEGVEGLKAVIRPGETKLVWIETPVNPTWEVLDIAAIAEVTRAAGAELAVDSTAATPVLTQPLALGADYVMHSATKYLGGHSDILGGLLVTRKQDERWEALRGQRRNGGAMLGAFEAWLLIRSLRTLYVRVRRQCETAMTVARHFEGHPLAVEVLYPGLPGHPQHALAARQMQGGFGGMLSIRSKGGYEGAARVARACKLWIEATSLGGVESLIEHRAAIEGPDSPIPQDLLRLSVGLELAADLISDLEQALQHA